MKKLIIAILAFMTFICINAQNQDNTYSAEVREAIEQQNFHGDFIKGVKAGLAPAFKEYGIEEAKLDVFVNDFWNYVHPMWYQRIEKVFRKNLTLDEVKQLNKGDISQIKKKMEKVSVEVGSESEELMKSDEVQKKMMELLARCVE